MNVSVEESALCALLVQKVKEHFQNEDNRKEFEIWYKQKYGKDYEWRN